MSYEVLIVLFLILSVVSSLINKMKESRDKERREENRPYVPLSRRRTPPVVEVEEEDDTLSEWDVLRELERHRRPTVEQEYREVRGTRHVSEEDTGPEFREVEPTRDVEEPEGVPEFREVQATRHVTEMAPSTTAEVPPGQLLPSAAKAMSEPVRVRRRCRGRLRLRLGPRALRRAIVLNEILGPPRADHMPW